MGQKNFAGAELISQLYGQALAAKGFQVTYKSLGGTEVIYPALKSGQIDLYGEYQGTLLTFLKGAPTGDAGTTNAALEAKLATDNIKLSDLTAVAPRLTFGGPPECGTRPLCLGDAAQSLYNLKFKTVKKLDAGGPITGSALKDYSIQVGLLFTGSSIIDPNFVLLTDDKGLQPADNVVAVWRTRVNSPTLGGVIDAVNAKLDTAAYNELSANGQPLARRRRSAMTVMTCNANVGCSCTK